MDLGAPCASDYLEHQQNEQSYVSFIYQYPATHKNISGLNPVVLGAPWGYAYLEHQQKEHSSVRYIFQSPTIHHIFPRD